MNNKEIHKFYKFVKELPEHHYMMKELLIEYLRLKEEIEGLYEHIDYLEEEIEERDKVMILH